MSNRSRVTTAAADRGVTDRELSLILERAIELQEQAADGGSDRGLSLDMVREIAREVGVDPRYVDRAARSVLARVTSERSWALLGAPMRERVETSFSRALSEPEMAELVAAIRGALGRQGEVSSALGAVEWKTDGLQAVAVTITPEPSATRVEILSDRSAALAPATVVPTAVGLVAAGIVVDTVQPGTAAMLALLGAGAVAGLGVGRTIWSILSRSSRRRVEALHEAIRRFMEKE